MIDHGLKWWPTKRYEASFDQHGTSPSWRLEVASVTRAEATFPTDGIPFCLVLTIADPAGARPIFQTFRQYLQTRGMQVGDTVYVTFAEIPPRAKDYPGALPHMLKAGSLVFSPPGSPVDHRDWSRWWEFKAGAYWRRPAGKGSGIHRLMDHPVVHLAYEDALAYAHWAGKEFRCVVRKG